MQYLVCWYFVRRAVAVLLKIAILALIVRVGSYWTTHHELPPLSLLQRDVAGVLSWLNKVGAIQWIQEIINEKQQAAVLDV